MVRIETLRSELAAIPDALSDATWEETQRPEITANVPDVTTQNEVGESPSPSVEPAAERPEGLPDWLETEIFREIDTKVAKRGIEALAWYVSFHFRNARWGIYLPDSTLLYLATRLFGQAAGAPPRVDSIAKAFAFIWRHEWFHFLTDYAVAQQELLLSGACWLPVQERCRHGSGYSLLEEKVANAYMLRRLEETKGSLRINKTEKRRILGFVGEQPPGYRDAETAIEDEAFADEQTDLIKLYAGPLAIERGVRMWGGAFDGTLPFHVGSTPVPAACPLHRIHDVSGIPPIALRFFTVISGIVESDRFCKSLGSLPMVIQKKWEKKKRLLGQRVPRHPEFEKMRGMENVYSVRVDDNYRAHLAPRPGFQAWDALNIGTHRAMGHD